MDRHFARPMAAALAAVGLAIAASPGWAQAIPNAAGDSTVKVTRFDSPLGLLENGGGFGYGTFLTSDAGMALIGTDPDANHCASQAAYVYERVSSEWMTSPSRVFTNPDGTTYTCAFLPAALSADGSTAVFGAPAYFPGAQSNVSRVYIYAHTDGLWSQGPVAVLRNPRPGGTDDDAFGFDPMKLSADGSTLLLSDWGAPVDGNIYAGRVYLYERNADGSWNTTPVATFIEPAAARMRQFGRGVAMTPDGSEVLIGASAPYSDSGEGAAYLYRKPADGPWPAQPQPVFVFNDPDATTIDRFGFEVSLSGTGDAAFILNYPNGGENAPVGQGIYLFEKTGGAWPAQPTGEFLVPNPTPDFPDNVIDDFTLSGDSQTLFVGAPRFMSGTQAPDCCNVVWVYTKQDGAWDYTSPSAMLQEPDAAASPYHNVFGGDYVSGYDIAASADGTTVLIGDPQFPIATPGGEPPNYAGPGVAFVFQTTNGWQGPLPPPPPPPAATGSGGGGGFGWLVPGLLFALILLRRRTLFGLPN